MKGRPKACRNQDSLSFMEEIFLERPHKSTQDRYWREENHFFLYNGFKKVKLSLYSCKIQIMQSLSLDNQVERLQFCDFWHHNLKKMRIGFSILCLKMSVIFSNRTISTSKICVFVQVGILINIQNKKMINNFHVRVRTGKQRNRRLFENFINF